MVSFPQTNRLIEDLEAHVPKQAGLHRASQQAVSVGGIDLGTTNYDPARHLPHMIDPMSPMEDVFNAPQVRVQLPLNPMLVTIIGDHRFGGDRPRIAEMKSQAVTTIIEGLVEAVPNLDINDTFVLDEGADPEEEEAQLLETCREGLCFIVGDFAKLRLIQPFSDRADILAIKVNHPAERIIVPNIGRISLGGLREIDTTKPRQLAAYNALLDSSHQWTMQMLHNAGAVADSIVLSPNTAGCIDIADADSVIASMIERV